MRLLPNLTLALLILILTLTLSTTAQPALIVIPERFYDLFSAFLATRPYADRIELAPVVAAEAAAVSQTGLYRDRGRFAGLAAPAISIWDAIECSSCSPRGLVSPVARMAAAGLGVGSGSALLPLIPPMVRTSGVIRAVPLFLPVHGILVRTTIAPTGAARIPSLSAFVDAVATLNETSSAGVYPMCLSRGFGVTAGFASLIGPFLQVHGTASGAYLVPGTLEPLFQTAGAQRAFNYIAQLVSMTRVVDDAELQADIVSGRCAYVIGADRLVRIANASAFRSEYVFHSVPGSREVYDREQQTLVTCDSAATCPHAVFGVNEAQGFALGLWAGMTFADASAQAQDNVLTFFIDVAKAELTGVLFSSAETAERWETLLALPSRLAGTISAVVQGFLQSPNTIAPLKIHRAIEYYHEFWIVLSLLVTGFPVEDGLVRMQQTWETLTRQVGMEKQRVAYAEALQPYVAGEAARSEGLSAAAVAVVVVVCCVVCALCIVMGFVIMRLRQRARRVGRADVSDDGRNQMYSFSLAEVDTVDYTELTIVRPVGMGSFGEVFLARWRDSDVAVKRMNTEAISTAQFAKFMAETQMLMSLRNANVIQYIGTVVNPPCLLTEYMERGSLFGVLHNPLISITFPLKLSWAIGIAEGMQFLHASGVLHRDFKSLNILISRAWTPKISDFGLSTLKVSESSKAGVGEDGAQAGGSVFWTAPEVLAGDVYTKAADVYSYGIVLWEIMSRAKLYPSFHSQYAVAMQVIRNTLRPPIGQMPDRPTAIRSLAQRCWHVEALQRPSFESVLSTLNAQAGAQIATTAPRVDIAEVPMGSVFVANTKLKRFSEWGLHLLPADFSVAVKKFQSVVDRVAKECGGFVWLHTIDQVCVAFQTGSRLVAYCAGVQLGMQDAEWSEAVLASPYGGVRAVEAGSDAEVLVGMAVGITVHYGMLRTHRDMKTDAIYYTHPGLDLIDDLQALCQGGQTLLSLAACSAKEVAAELIGGRAIDISTLDDISAWPAEVGELFTYDLGSGRVATYMSVQLPGVAARCFGVMDGVTRAGDEWDDEVWDESSAAGSGVGALPAKETVQHDSFAAHQQSMMKAPPPASPLVTASPWISEPHEFELVERVGIGSYAATWRGRWRDAEVCIKIFLLQQLTPRELVALVCQFLEYRRLTIGPEAFDEWLPPRKVPNIVSASGVCVRPPMVGFFTEYIHDAAPLSDFLKGGKRLGLRRGLHIFRQIAIGIIALHARNLFHGALCPNNVLIAPGDTVHLTDYGFFDVRVSLQTATAVGDVIYAAPEVLLGEPMTRRADIYALGMLLYGILTGREPAITTSSMESALHVIQGKRPGVAGISQEAMGLVNICWHQSAHVRPTAEQVLQIVDGWTVSGFGRPHPSLGDPM